MSIAARLLRTFRTSREDLPSFNEKASVDKINLLEQAVNRRFSEVSREIKKNEQTNYQTHMELRCIFDNPAVMPALQGYAISPEPVFYLLDLLEKYKPQSILEFGSSFSSVVFSRYAHGSSARVISVDHESPFAQKCEAAVNACGYADNFKLIITRVIEQKTNRKRALFYDRSALDDFPGFDFVVLDGPPQKLGTAVKGRLLPLFRPLLTPSCIIVLDDYYRPGGREIVSTWLKERQLEIIEESEFIEKHTAAVRVI